MEDKKQPILNGEYALLDYVESYWLEYLREALEFKDLVPDIFNPLAKFITSKQNPRFDWNVIQRASIDAFNPIKDQNEDLYHNICQADFFLRQKTHSLTLDNGSVLSIL